MALAQDSEVELRSLLESGTGLEIKQLISSSSYLAEKGVNNGYLRTEVKSNVFACDITLIDYDSPEVTLTVVTDSENKFQNFA
ncbi:hypothetical protein NPIL_73251 [Nephila pilipes]|uniref:Uncharacterized protein n=1 Tax=Nephila pilipes TaxID=299642 RepID=A0A8X6U7M6_NEPPI|nr:hypothetical protein NPIL_73251 [Nephila pilipes]